MLRAQNLRTNLGRVSWLLVVLLGVFLTLSPASFAEAQNNNQGGKVQICHRPPGNPDNLHTITVSANAVASHLAHGDSLGPCATQCEAVVCQASDQCHDAGTCNPATGLCSDPAKADGSACSDGDACTQTDTCQAGACVGSNPLVCPTTTDTCVGGVCTPSPFQPHPLLSSFVCQTDNDCAGFFQNNAQQLGFTQCMGQPICMPTHSVLSSNGITRVDVLNCEYPPTLAFRPCSDGNPLTFDECLEGVCFSDANAAILYNNAQNTGIELIPIFECAVQVTVPGGNFLYLSWGYTLNSAHAIHNPVLAPDNFIPGATTPVGTNWFYTTPPGSNVGFAGGFAFNSQPAAVPSLFHPGTHHHVFFTAVANDAFVHSWELSTGSGINASPAIVRTASDRANPGDPIFAFCPPEIVDCFGIPNGLARLDDCGVCNGNNEAAVGMSCPNLPTGLLP